MNLSDDSILLNMFKLEKYYIVESDYFNNEINNEMRELLSIWILEICEEENLLHHIYYLTMNLFDRFMSTLSKSTTFKINQAYLQLFGTCCMFLASKLKGNVQLDSVKLVEYTDNSIELEELLQCELFILDNLKWDVECITPNDYLEILLHRLDLSECDRLDQIKNHFYAITALCPTDIKFSQYPASVIASSCLLSALSYVNVLTDKIETNLHNLLNKFGQFDYKCLFIIRKEIKSLFLTKSNEKDFYEHHQLKQEQVSNVKFEDDYDFNCEFNNLYESNACKEPILSIESFLTVSPFNQTNVYQKLNNSFNSETSDLGSSFNSSSSFLSTPKLNQINHF